MRRAISEVLEDVQLFAKLGDVPVATRANVERIGEASRALPASKYKEIQPKSFQTIESKSSAGLVLADGTKHLA